MSYSINRREWLAAAGAGALLLQTRSARAEPIVNLRDCRVISWLPHRYHGWPTVTRRADGRLLLVCSGGREGHVCPFGRVELMRSDDDGESWSWPRVVMDSPIDDRDAGVIETARGSILITTFTSLAYEPRLAEAERIAAAPAGPGEEGAWPEEELGRWRAAHSRIDAAQRKLELGVWMIRSTDGGVRWSSRYDCLVHSPHGPVQLSDGRLLYAGKDLWRGDGRVGVCQSLDDGQSWSWLSDIPARPGDSTKNYHELHAVETADNRILVQIRNHNQCNYRETLQCESTDGGRTWSEPHSISVWGLPSHLLRLRDDRLLMTYGHRRQPLGNQVRLSEDHGRTWSPPLILSGDGSSSDLGYPSTVELDDGSLLTVWYERLSDSPFAVLRQARWSICG